MSMPCPWDIRNTPAPYRPGPAPYRPTGHRHPAPYRPPTHPLFVRPVGHLDPDRDQTGSRPAAPTCSSLDPTRPGPGRSGPGRERTPTGVGVRNARWNVDAATVGAAGPYDGRG